MDAAQAACDTVEKLEKKFFDDHGEKHTHPPLPPCPLHGPQEKRGVLERRNWLRIKGNDIAVDTAAFATDKPWFPTPRRRVHQSVVALLGKTILTVFFLFFFSLSFLFLYQVLKKRRIKPSSSMNLSRQPLPSSIRS